MFDRIIIGGGVTGLTCAYELHKQGKRVLLLEAEKLGGLIRTEQVSGFTLERGPNVFLSKGPLMELTRELGLDDLIAYPQYKRFRQHVWHDGRPCKVPKDPVSFFRSPLIGQGWHLRILNNIFFGRLPRIEAEDATVAQFFTPILGDHAVRALLSTVMKGVYGSSAEAVSARVLLPGMWDAAKRGLLFRQYLKERAAAGTRARVFTFRGGMQSITGALQARLIEANVVRLARVTRVLRQETSFEVALNDGTKVLGKELYISTAGPASGTYLGELLPELSRQLNQVTHVPLIVVHAAVAPNAPLLEKSFGILFPDANDRRIIGVMFNSLLFPHLAPDGSHLCTIMLGGASGRSVMDLDDTHVFEAVRKELNEYLGLVPASFLALTRWAKAIPEYPLGHFRLVDMMRRAEKDMKGLHFLGADTGGPGVADRVATAREAAGTAR